MRYHEKGSLVTPVQKEEVVVSGEAEIQEFKEMTRTRCSAAMAACIMFNLGGGRVLFGVTPQGEVTDLSHRYATTHQAGDRLIPATQEHAFSGGD